MCSHSMTSSCGLPRILCNTFLSFFVVFRPPRYVRMSSDRNIYISQLSRGFYVFFLHSFSFIYQFLECIIRSLWIRLGRFSGKCTRTTTIWPHTFVNLLFVIVLVKYIYVKTRTRNFFYEKVFLLLFSQNTVSYYYYHYYYYLLSTTYQVLYLLPTTSCSRCTVVPKETRTGRKHFRVVFCHPDDLLVCDPCTSRA